MKPKQFYFVLLGVLAVLILGGAAGYYFATQATARRTQALQTKLAEVEVATLRLDQLAALKSQFQKAAPLLPLAEAVLPKTKNQSEISVQLVSAAAVSGMNLSTLTFPDSTGGGIPGPTSKSAKVGEFLVLPVSFQLSGSYGQLQTFLRTLESMNRFNSVGTLNITRTGSGGILNFSLTVNAYFKP